MTGRVSGTVVVGPHGHCVSEGYTDIGGTRFYDDKVVVGRDGQHEIVPGRIEGVPSSVHERLRIAGRWVR